jgi:hypothetical protein
MSVATPCSQISQLGGIYVKKYMNEKYSWKPETKIRERERVCGYVREKKSIM